MQPRRRGGRSPDRWPRTCSCPDRIPREIGRFATGSPGTGCPQPGLSRSGSAPRRQPRLRGAGTAAVRERIPGPPCRARGDVAAEGCLAEHEQATLSRSQALPASPPRFRARFPREMKTVCACFPPSQGALEPLGNFSPIWATGPGRLSPTAPIIWVSHPATTHPAAQPRSANCIRRTDSQRPQSVPDVVPKLAFPCRFHENKEGRFLSVEGKVAPVWKSAITAAQPRG